MAGSGREEGIMMQCALLDVLDADSDDVGMGYRSSLG